MIEWQMAQSLQHASTLEGAKENLFKAAPLAQQTLQASVASCIDHTIVIYIPLGSLVGA